MGRRSQRVAVSCAICGGDKLLPPSQIAANTTGRFYCSNACLNKGRAKFKRTTKTVYVQVPCATCGKNKRMTEKYAARSATGLFFCSNECKDGAVIPHPARRVDKVTVECARCGTTREIIPSHAAKNTTGRFFCSEECRRLTGSKPRTRPEHICEVCGKSFRVLSNAPGRFCSVTCNSEYRKRTRVSLTCAQCTVEMWRHPSTITPGDPVYCSAACRDAARIKNGLGRFHNGKEARLNKQGYVYIYEPGNPDAHLKGSWILEHRWVAAQKLGRRLRPDEQVHHINGDGTDNHPDNLAVLNAREHTLITVAEAGMKRQASQRRIRELEAEVAAYQARYGPLT